MQSELHVDPNIYNPNKFPNFGRPKIIGYIGYENLKFARTVTNTNVNFDLNHNSEATKHRPEDLDVKITELLKFLLENEKRLNFPFESCLDKSKFFCYRGLLTCVALTPYENREPWKIVAMLYKGNIYLCARDTEEKLHRKRNMSHREKLCTSWGYKFEQFLMCDTPEGKPDLEKPLDEMEEFSLVFTTHLNSHTIVYGAEMDGIRADRLIPHPPSAGEDPNTIIEYLSSKEYIELKTNRIIEYNNQETSFRRHKAKKWWCQSFLAGINTILCGYRDDDGIVHELKVFNIKDLVNMSKRFWNPNVCFNFLDNFLTYVKRCFNRELKRKFGAKSLTNVQSLPMVSMLFEWRPGAPITVTENYVYADDPILPSWFLDGYGNRSK